MPQPWLCPIPQPPVDSGKVCTTRRHLAKNCLKTPPPSLTEWGEPDPQHWDARAPTVSDASCQRCLILLKVTAFSTPIPILRAAAAEAAGGRAGAMPRPWPCLCPVARGPALRSPGRSGPDSVGAASATSGTWAPLFPQLGSSLCTIPRRCRFWFTPTPRPCSPRGNPQRGHPRQAARPACCPGYMLPGSRCHV